MPKFNRRRSHSRRTNLKTKFFTDALASRNTEDSPAEEEPEEENNTDEGDKYDFSAKEMLNDISILYSLCAESVNNKYLSTLMYVSLRHLGHAWREVDSFLSAVGGMTSKTCHKHSMTFLNSDIDEFCVDERGGKQSASFYDVYPELEELGRLFAVEGCSRKNSSFTVKELADFIDEQYYILTGDTKGDQPLVRSPQSLRLDLRRWGIRYSANKIRPYWIGHERDDVVDHRRRFVDYFSSREDDYYTVTPGEDPKWILPVSSDPAIILCKSSLGGSNKIVPFSFSKVTMSRPSGPTIFLQNDGWQETWLPSFRKVEEDRSCVAIFLFVILRLRSSLSTTKSGQMPSRNTLT